MTKYNKQLTMEMTTVIMEKLRKEKYQKILYSHREKH
jgi:hypothetical protein